MIDTTTFPEYIRLEIPSESGATECVGRAHVFERAYPGGTTGTPTSFLLSAPEAPVPGARIRWKERVFDVRTVRVCRDHEGNVAAYRCEAE